MSAYNQPHRAKYTFYENQTFWLDQITSLLANTENKTQSFFQK